MPVTPNYSVPTFNAAGSTDIGAAMTQWVQDFNTQYRTDQEAVSRTPYIVSTFSAAGGAGGSVIVAKNVTLLGGEQVQAQGFADVTVPVNVTSTNSGGGQDKSIRMKLRVTYPAGTVTTFANQDARLRVSLESTAAAATLVQTSVTISAGIAFTWPIEARFQNGGEHKFTLITTGAGSWNSGTLSLLVL